MFPNTFPPALIIGGSCLGAQPKRGVGRVYFNPEINDTYTALLLGYGGAFEV
jgi:hypothetical protein